MKLSACSVVVIGLPWKSFVAESSTISPTVARPRSGSPSFGGMATRRIPSARDAVEKLTGMLKDLIACAGGEGLRLALFIAE
jgi:hypothetical protein